MILYILRSPLSMMLMMEDALEKGNDCIDRMNTFSLLKISGSKHKSEL